MPTLEAFAGLRYDATRVRLDDVIAPPYDVITSNERQRLASRHRANAVLVELPEADLMGRRDRYAVAADLLAGWRATGVLALDPRPSLYPYRMTSPDGRRSTGVIGALRLPEAGQDDVLPHEQTLAKPRSDRLDLLRATATNLSPIWGLSLARGLSAAIDLDGRTPTADAHDDQGVRHQLWVLEDPDLVATIGGVIEQAPIVIADGHHRYQTAIAYQQERRASSSGAPGLYDLVMALVMELSEEEVHVEAIHRTLSGPAPLDVPGTFGRWFDVIRAGPATPRTVGALVDAGSMALVTPDEAYLLQANPDAFDAAGSDLDASLVELVLGDLEGYEATHRHTWQEAAAAVAGGTAQAALLLRPVRVTQIAEWATTGRRMPPKTTYFSPKPRTGLVFRPLDLGPVGS